jgi:hypothetical protein
VLEGGGLQAEAVEQLQGVRPIEEWTPDDHAADLRGHAT